ncbi:hypothetical protein EYF80_012031 [Liparis tanakae]|uniref:Uncharacterized protein n=1 Tax=Liparis tanakae TaxID=230148 RepID=A0A4Z2IKM3_9TELE|nr:hypothetical protein EYF80_012031 [Liparis tanakae]
MEAREVALTSPRKCKKHIILNPIDLHPTCSSESCTSAGMRAVGLTLDLKRRLMTPFERLSAVRSEFTQTDMLLLSLLALTGSSSSAPPITAKDRPPHTKTFSVLLIHNQLTMTCPPAAGPFEGTQAVLLWSHQESCVCVQRGCTAVVSDAQQTRGHRAIVDAGSAAWTDMAGCQRHTHRFEVTGYVT